VKGGLSYLPVQLRPFTTCTCTYMYVYILVLTHSIYPHIQDGLTALHLAADCGHEDVLELLFEANMDPDIKDQVTTQHVR